MPRRTSWNRAILVFVALALPAAGRAQPGPPNEHFRVDQFGYRPSDSKIAVLRAAQTGHDAPDPWAPSSPVTVRRASDDSVAFSSDALAWRAGAEHDQSGDRAWHFDFSALEEPGSYYLRDEASGLTSGTFEIADEPHAVVLKAALRSLLYQRCGVPKLSAHAGASWSDAACHLGAEQDLDCRSVLDPTPASSLDLSGGWHDAGDYNKYVNFADGPIHDLLAAWRENPEAFDDDAGLPESGNGLPDVLDEARVELDWFLKMQLPDGSVRHKVSVTDFSAASPPSADGGARRHSPAGASSTISACGAWAHAATVFGRLGVLEGDALAAVYRTAALVAWDWLDANPSAIPSTYDNAGFASANPEQSEYDQRAGRTAAAAYLFELTGETRFRDHVDATFRDVHLLQWGFVYAFEHEYQDALLLHASHPDATPATATAIQDAYRASLEGGDNLQHHRDADDPYGAWLSTNDHVWGSNRTRSHAGLQYLLELRHGFGAVPESELLEAGARYLRYLHGVNPGGLVYLTNMGSAGAERSCTQVYHSWFADGTAWDEVGVSAFGPPPGILPGGPNRNYAPDPAYTGPPIEPPQNQPVQKAYLDWNTSWPENSWEVTENQVAYQAAYIRLLAWFVGDSVASGPIVTEQPANVTACSGEAAELAVTATGTEPLSYQWLHEGSPVPDAPPWFGGTTDRLTVDPADELSRGSYRCLITDAAGVETLSNSALLSVVALPDAVGDSLRLSRSPGTLALRWSAPSRATEHVVLRCDASLGDCAPVEHARSATPEHEDPLDATPRLWYLVAGANSCGTGP